MPDDVAAALDLAHREEWAKVLATLARQVGGDLALAEDAVQDAFVAAAAQWPEQGVPANAGAWLTTTARRRAIDRVRREQTATDHRADLAHQEMLVQLDTDTDTETDPTGTSRVADDRLRLVFTCCHPALALEARVALTLRAVGGLEVPQIARAFLTTEPTMYQRITRAKAKIRKAGIPYRVPADDQLTERFAGVLHVVYLVFNEGHTATVGDDLLDVALSDEAIRLARLLVELLPDDPDALGLLALLLLTDARRAARLDDAGEPVALEDQDRSLWDRDRIAEGIGLVERALRPGRPAPFPIQAAVAALHAEAPTFEATDWAQIAALYAELEAVDPSAVVTVNRAVAVAHAEDPTAGLAVLARLDDDEWLEAYQPLWAARAELLHLAGDFDGARRAYDRALALTANQSERAALSRRAARTSAGR